MEKDYSKSAVLARLEDDQSRWAKKRRNATANRTKKYTVTAVIVSPLVGVFLGTIAIFVYGFSKANLSQIISNIPEILSSAFVTAIVGFMFSFPFTVLFGLPVFFLLKRMQAEHWLMYALFGLLGGVAFSALLGEMVDLFIGSGMITALVFWLIAVHIPSRKMQHVSSA